MKKGITFVNFPTTFYSVHLPYSLLWLSTYLNKNSGFKASILDLKATFLKRVSKDEFYRRAIARLKEIDPAYVGVPSYTPDYKMVMEFSRLIKTELPQVKVIVGNVHASLFPNDFIFEGSPVDFVVIGEGELALSELLRVLENKDSLSDLKGIAYFDKESGFVRTPPRELVEDLDDLPIPDYGLLDMDTYLKPTFFLIRRLPIRGVGIYAGRGCPYKCIFCAANTLWRCNIGRPVRFRNPSTIIKEIEVLQKRYGIEGFYFMDDTFTARKDFVLEFCDRIKSMGLVWASSGRVNEIDDEMAKGMKSAGCLQLDFGVESGSDKILQTIKKRITSSQIKSAFDVCKRNGIRTFANMMVNLPTETEEDIRLSERLLRRIRPTRVAVAVATPLPATELHDRYLKEKIEPEDYERLRFRGEQDARFKFSEHNISSAKTYRRLDRIVRPLVPDYVRIFTNKAYQQAVSQRNRTWRYFCLSLSTWINEYLFSRVIAKARIVLGIRR